MVDDACISNLTISQLNPRYEDLADGLLHAIPTNFPKTRYPASNISYAGFPSHAWNPWTGNQVSSQLSRCLTPVTPPQPSDPTVAVSCRATVPHICHAHVGGLCILVYPEI